MATQLDPVTGAPLLTPDLGNIDQLPYKVQPVPLQDLTNQPQLGRTYLYPDDVPPVLANINAMSGTQTDQAQTLHTDGSHALLVSDVSGGGGGGGLPIPTTISAAELPDNGADSDNWLNAFNWSTLKTIYRIDLFAELIGAPSASDRAIIYFGLAADGTTLPTWFPWVLYVGNGESTLTTGLPYATTTIDLGGGLDVGTYLGTNVPGCFIYFNNKVAPVRVGATLYGVP